MVANTPNISWDGVFKADQMSEIARIIGENNSLGKADSEKTKSTASWLNSNEIAIMQDDGDTFVIRGMDLSAGKSGYLDTPKAGEVQGAPAATTTPTTQAPRTATLPPATGGLEQQLAIRQRQKAENEQRIAVLEEQIKQLTEEINKEIEKALAEVEGLTEEQKKNASTIADNWLKKYADGECTYDQMQAGMQGDITSSDAVAGQKISTALTSMFGASTKMAILKDHVNTMGILIAENKLIDAEIKSLQDQIAAEAARRAAEAAAAAAAAAARNTSCDPIGFTSGNVTYDFFVDTDKNGVLSNENEFLGAKDQWAEMEALDGGIDGVKDGKVSKEEMAQAGIKVVTRDSVSKEQKVMDASELDFKEIDLATYNTGKAGDQGNGVNLLGNFNINFGGQDIEGYNTLDSLDYLDNNYTFSDKANGLGRFGAATATNAVTATAAGTTEDFQARHTEIQKQVKELEAKLDNAWLQIFGKESTAKSASQAVQAQAYLDGTITKAQKESEAKAQEKIEADANIQALKEEEQAAAARDQQNAATDAAAAQAATQAAATPTTAAAETDELEMVQLTVAQQQLIDDLGITADELNEMGNDAAEEILAGV